jgi:hypothetical protein
MAIEPEDYSAHFSEFYFADRSVEVVATIGGKERRVHIDVLFDGTAEFSTQTYILQDFALQPAYPNDDMPAESHSIWVRWTDFPPTRKDTAEIALQQALGFLRERCQIRG